MLRSGATNCTTMGLTPKPSKLQMALMSEPEKIILETQEQ